MDDECLFRSGSACERALLAAGLDEAPSERSLRAASIALGIVPTTQVVATEVAGLRRFARVRWLKLAVNVLAPVVVVGGSIAAIDGVWSRPQHLPRVTAVAPPGPPSSSSVSMAPAALGAATAMATATALTEPIVIAATPPSVGRNKADPFGAQVAIIDRARAKAGAGNTAATLQAVDEYDRRFPGGLLSEEALLLRIEALAARGSRDAAAGLARRFLAEYPRSVHADRLRPLVEGGSR